MPHVQSSSQRGVDQGDRRGVVGTCMAIYQYADDTILLGEAEPETFRGFRFILKCFERLSGLKINMHKSALIPINVDALVVSRETELIECLDRLRKEDWSGMVNRMIRRLDGWKWQQLSFGGHIILLQAGRQQWVSVVVTHEGKIRPTGRMAEKFGETINWELGEGSRAHFWGDTWLEGRALCARFPLAF
ncbi:hypothetical protein QJS10_CPB12g00756 [Acorus calamus]|uniref:Reverse transcriptase domain-containing protein n=1 Tax=Acorus calamus TaxID=4465 RepID=A0AAV9DNL9_ACOCL|nr:hypothetical protein QJS10_CPB12g00756 [Acorus calamus]